MTVMERHLAHLTYEWPEMNEWQLCGSGGYLKRTLASAFKTVFALKN